MNTKFKIFSKLFIELLIVLGIFRDLSKELKAFFTDIFLNNLKDFMLLKELSRDVQRKILRIDYTLNKTKVIRNNFCAVVHDKDSSNIKFDVVLLFLGFKEIERSSFGNVKN